MNLEFLLIDVFTDRPFGGSRLYLFPGGGDVPVELMQKLAMELGPGETAFIVPARSGGDERSGLRVFTPSAEIPFGGHSVLGATFAVDHYGLRQAVEDPVPFTWELEAGPYQVLTRPRSGQRVYSLVQDNPIFMGQYFHRGKVARTLGLSEEDIAITGLPCEVISTGLPIHIVPLASLVFTCETVADDSTVHCRMFAPHFGIPEDAASGAATGALVAYLIKHRLIRIEPRVRIISEQGLELGRPSRVVAAADIQGGQAVNIEVGGQCVLVGTGTINIP